MTLADLTTSAKAAVVRRRPRRRRQVRLYVHARASQKTDEQHEHGKNEKRDLGHHRHAEIERHRTTPAIAFATFGRLEISGDVAVSIVPTAIQGATPKITSVATRMPSAAHSGPWASDRCAKCGSGLFVPQKICFVTRST